MPLHGSRGLHGLRKADFEHSISSYVNGTACPPSLPNSLGYLAQENHKSALRNMRPNAMEGGIGNHMAEWDWHGLGAQVG